MGFLPVLGAALTVASSAKSLFSGGPDPQEAGKSSSTTEEITHRLPVEEGSAAIAGNQLAAQWAQMQEMARSAALSQGISFGGGAVEAGRSALDTGANFFTMGDNREAEYNSYNVQNQARAALEMKMKYLGINAGNGANDVGIKMSFDDFVKLRTYKDPSAMIAQGKSLRDPIGDDEWDGLGQDLGMTPAATRLVQMLGEDPQLSGDGLRAMGQMDSAKGQAIKELMAKGLVNSNMVVNQGQLAKQYAKLQESLIQNRTTTPLTPELTDKLRTEYLQLSEKDVDPKMIKETSMGDGTTRLQFLNADGTVAGSVLSGNMRLPNGQVVHGVDVIGSAYSDWKAVQKMVDGTGDLFAVKKPPKAPKNEMPEGLEGLPNLSEKQGGNYDAQGGDGLAALLSKMGGGGGGGGGQAMPVDSMDIGNDMMPPGAMDQGQMPQMDMSQLSPEQFAYFQQMLAQLGAAPMSEGG